MLQTTLNYQEKLPNRVYPNQLAKRKDRGKMSNTEKVICPYCGAEMCVDSYFKREFGPRYFCHCWSCGSMGPDGSETEETARAAALKRYRPIQKPLTVEELREMPLFAWVWIEILTPSAFDDFFVKAKSAYYGKQLDYSNGEAFCCGYPGIGYSYDYCDYGKTWIALQHEPTDEERKAAKWGTTHKEQEKEK